MNRVVRFALITGLVGLVITSGLGQTPDADWTVYLRRAGMLTIGMSLVEARRAVGDPDAFLVQALHQGRDLPHEPDDSPCAYLVTRNAPDQIGLMFQRGRLARVDVWRSGIRTAAGAQVGDTEARILDLYGARIEVKQHNYPPAGAHYMIFRPVDAVDREYRMLFETDGSRVIQFRIGTVTAVGQVEGCA